MTDITKKTKKPYSENTQIQETSFSYEGYQVVRGEFFAHLFEPSVTLNAEKVSVNSACINKLPDVDYVQFLVNPAEKKLAVKPCDEQDKDSFRWCSITNDGKRKPKSISCRIFFAKIVDLMQWDPTNRYKILGKLIRTPADILFVFDLTCAETFQKRSSGGNANPRLPLYPHDWSNQFGIPVKEHQDTTLINIFDDYTVFRIEKEETKKEHMRHATDNDTGCEETSDKDTSENTESN